MKLKTYLTEFWHFGIKNAISCLFPAYIFFMLGLSHMQHWLPRYDFMLVAALAMQAAMLLTKLETYAEFRVICLFHLLGLGMEIFKVHVGSWRYPEDAWTKIAGVPLYSGFMYASVASYMCQAWRRFDLHITGWPKPYYALPLAVLVYLNFFTNHIMYDVRYILGIAIVPVFYKARVHYKPSGNTYTMPVLVSFMLIGFFIWVAENMATILGAWQYTYQHTGWAMVKLQKVSSWTFLVMVSYIIVAELQRGKHSGRQ